MSLHDNNPVVQCVVQAAEAIALKYVMLGRQIDFKLMIWDMLDRSAIRSEIKAKQR